MTPTLPRAQRSAGVERRCALACVHVTLGGLLRCRACRARHAWLPRCRACTRCRASYQIVARAARQNAKSSARSVSPAFPLRPWQKAAHPSLVHAKNGVFDDCLRCRRSAGRWPIRDNLEGEFCSLGGKTLRGGDMRGPLQWFRRARERCTGVPCMFGNTSREEQSNDTALEFLLQDTPPRTPGPTVCDPSS